MKRHLLWIIPLLCFLALTPFTPSLDLKISSYFYTPPSEGMPGHFVHLPFFKFLFKYGEELGLLVGIIAALLYFATFFWEPIRRWRRGALVMVLSLVLGAGLLTNVLFKGYWGRPRPRQVEEFGGKHAFRPYYFPNWDADRDTQKSFPSGHATMGFYYLTICVVAYYYRSRPWMVVGIVMTATLGPLLALTRLVQGGHFLSDVLFSALLMWCTALFCGWLVFRSGRWGRLEWVRGEAIG